MARNNAIDGLVNQIQLTSGFENQSGGSAVAYDHRVLMMGIDRAAVILANSFSNQRMVINGKTEIIYELSCELYVRHNNDIVQARRDADIYASNIIQRINNNPTLGGSVHIALTTDGRIEDERVMIGKTPFLLEVLTISATEHLDAV